MKTTLLELRTGDKTKCQLWCGMPAVRVPIVTLALLNMNPKMFSVLTWIIAPGWQARPVELGAIQLSVSMNKPCCTLTRYTNSVSIALFNGRQQILLLSSSVLVSHIQMKSLKSFLLEVHCKNSLLFGLEGELGDQRGAQKYVCFSLLALVVWS